MRQVLYVSTATSQVHALDPKDILDTSVRNNERDGITGLLYADGKRFLQVLEGDELIVARTLKRIELDKRHRAIVILSDRTVNEREFGAWSMALRGSKAEAEAFMAQVAEKIAGASASVRATFSGFVETRRAA